MFLVGLDSVNDILMAAGRDSLRLFLASFFSKVHGDSQFRWV